MNSTITTKGQVTIPKAMREYLNLQPGDKVVFSYIEPHGVRIEAVTCPGFSDQS